MSMHSQQFETRGPATGYERGQAGGGGGGQAQLAGQEPGQQGPGQQGLGHQQMGGQQQTGGQQRMGGQQAGGHGTFESSLTGPMRLALHDFVESAMACDWCADQCIDVGPQMADCIRLCRDVSDLATTNVQFMARDSVFGPETARLFADAAEECARECARHPHDHCQECASVLSRAVDSTRRMLGSFQQGGTGQGQFGQQPQQGYGQQPQYGQSQQF